MTPEESVATDRFEFACMGSPAELAEYLEALARELTCGEVALQSGGDMLRLVPPAELSVSLVVVEEPKARIALALRWASGLAARLPEVRVGAGVPGGTAAGGRRASG